MVGLVLLGHRVYRRSQAIQAEPLVDKATLIAFSCHIGEEHDTHRLRTWRSKRKQHLSNGDKRDDFRIVESLLQCLGPRILQMRPAATACTES